MDETENITMEVVEETITYIEDVPIELQNNSSNTVEEPVSEEPVSEEPASEEPVSEEPALKEPVSEEPASEEPVSEEPVSEEVTTSEEPVSEEPASEEPVSEEPASEEPTSEEPTSEEPTSEEVKSIESNTFSRIIPKLIFIVPYRDREQHQRFFELHMKNILSDYSEDEYKIIYSHQNDKREFNRGAMKNIGFLYAKSLYPNDYQNITFVFNDVDTMPYTKNFLNYETIHGTVKHFYGYTFTLGGIVSIKGSDFERTNGYPNYWAWGYEDNAFNNRVKRAGLMIDRSQFYPILDTHILQLKDGIIRTVNRGEYDRYVDEVKYNSNNDGINTISNIVHLYDDTTSFLNISNFTTLVEERPELNKIHDMRSGPVPFFNKGYRRGRPAMRLMF